MPHHGQRVYTASRLHNRKNMSRVFDKFVRFAISDLQIGYTSLRKCGVLR